MGGACGRELASVLLTKLVRRCADARPGRAPYEKTATTFGVAVLD